ncbi:MAG TPA: phage portal protein [Armatimonadota bacterium]|jgi:PBSX family phage portal protein
MSTIVAKRVAAAPASQQSRDSFAYDRMRCEPPPYDLAALSRAYEEDPDVYLCCNAIAAKAVGAGWEVTGEGPDDARSFFSDASRERPLLETLRLAYLDLNLLGNAYIEVARDGRDRPAGLWWIPAREMRARRDGDGFCQRTASDRYTLFNPYTPRASDRAAARATGEWHRAEGGGWANEVIAWRLPNPNSRFYGLPPAYVAAKDILADASVKDSNIAFFQNGMLPDYVLAVKGGTLSEGTLEEIRTFLQDAHRGVDRHHGMIILEAIPAVRGENVSLELIPMQQAAREMPFLAYRKFAIENKVRAFRVPMSKAGINQAGRLGEASGREEAETFKTEVVEPQQTMVEHSFDALLRDDLRAPTLGFRFRDMESRDTVQMAEAAARLAGNEAVLSPEAARAWLGIPDGVAPA